MFRRRRWALIGRIPQEAGLLREENMEEMEEGVE